MAPPESVVICDTNLTSTEVNRAESQTLRAEYLDFLAGTGIDLAFSDKRPESWPNPFNEDGTFSPEGTRRLIRVLESSRGYFDWKAVGTEPRANFLYRLGTVRTQRGPYLAERLPPLQDVLDRDADQVLAALAKANRKLPFPVYVGLHPEGEFSARVHPVGDGVLVLVNSGLMDLVFSVLKINLANSGDEADPPPLEDWQASMALAEAFNAYLYGDGSLKAWSLPRLDQHREQFLEFVLHSAECFVVAHEIAHVVLGHVRLPKRRGARATVTLTPRTELEADALAVELMTLASGIRVDEPDEARFLAGGISAIITMQTAVEMLRRSQGVRGPATGTHPGLGERWDHLANLLEQRLPETRPLERGEIFFGWLILNRLPEVLEWFAEIGTMVKRPSKWDA